MCARLPAIKNAAGDPADSLEVMNDLHVIARGH